MKREAFQNIAIIFSICLLHTVNFLASLIINETLLQPSCVGAPSQNSGHMELPVKRNMRVIKHSGNAL